MIYTTAVFIVEVNTPLLAWVSRQLAPLPLEITRRRNCETSPFDWPVLLHSIIMRIVSIVLDNTQAGWTFTVLYKAEAITDRHFGV